MSYRFLWLIWFYWVAWLVHATLTGAGISRDIVLLLVAGTFTFFSVYCVAIRGRMRFFFNRDDMKTNTVKVSCDAQIQEHIGIDEFGKHPTFIADGVVMTGEMESKGDIITEGTILGNISCVGEARIVCGGQVKGDIHASRIIVNGRVEGCLNSESILLGEKGVICGDIYTDTLVIEKGGVFTGQSHERVSNEAEKKMNILRSAEEFVSTDRQSIAYTPDALIGREKLNREDVAEDV